MASNTTEHPTAPAAGPPGLRGHVACSWCHIRRVRCDAYQGLPCSNCTSSKQNCQLIESKRGKYVRTHTKNSSARWSRLSNVNGTQIFHPQAIAAATPLRTIGIFPSSLFDSPAMTGLVPTTNTHTDSTYWTPWADYASYLVQSGTINEVLTIREGSEMLYARLSEFHLSHEKSQTLDCRRTVYLGESFPLTYIVREVISLSSDGVSSPGSSPKLQYTVPPTIDDKAQNLGYDTRLEPEEIEWLKLRGSFSLPEKSISDRLVRTYFDSVHPAFPIFDRSEFAILYSSNKLSLLTLQVVFLLAATLCEEELIQQAGFVDRGAARKAFHKRAKALYDADYETDKVTVVTALLLISFCWNGSMDEKDMWHWTGSAIGLAQAQGMHRSTTHSDLSIKDQRLWRRIWWSLYVRDRHSAAGLGRPIRIRDEDCDVEMLQESDFEETEPPDPSVFGVQTRTHVLYAIHLAKLSIVFGSIILTKFAVRKPINLELDKAVLVTQLKAWTQELPLDLTHRGVDEAGDGEYWVNMLDAAYNHHLILLHRPDQGSMSSSGASSEGIAFGAAKRITRIIDDLLATETLRRSQLQICLSIFAAMTMHVIVLRRSNPIQQNLAENHARLCMLGLNELQKSWPACSWILRLFDSLLQNPTLSGTGLSRSNVDESMRMSNTRPEEESSGSNASLQPTAQISLGENQDRNGVVYDEQGQNTNVFFDQLDPLVHMPLSDGNDNLGSGTFISDSFNQSEPQDPEFSMEMCSDFNASNSEFLSYLMQHFPEA